MYEMVTGHVPFDGDSTVSIAIKQSAGRDRVRRREEVAYSDIVWSRLF